MKYTINIEDQLLDDIVIEYLKESVLTHLNFMNDEDSLDILAALMVTLEFLMPIGTYKPFEEKVYTLYYGEDYVK